MATAEQPHTTGNEGWVCLCQSWTQLCFNEVKLECETDMMTDGSCISWEFGYFGSHAGYEHVVNLVLLSETS